MATEAKIVLTGDDTPLQRTLDSAKDRLANFSEAAMKPFNKLREQLGGLNGIIAGIGAVKLTGIVDQMALIEARMRDVGGSILAAQEAQAELFKSAQQLQVGYGEISGTFAKMLPSVQQMGGGAKEAIRLAEILTVTARLSGASSQEAAASAQQFGQALASGVLQGDELKSILENNSTLARTLASSLGVTIGELRKLGSEGKLTADVVAKALLGQYDEIKARSAELPVTVGGAVTNVENSFSRLIATVEKGQGIFGGLARIIQQASKLLDAMNDSLTRFDSKTREIHDSNWIGKFSSTAMESLAGLIDLGGILSESAGSWMRTFGALAESAKALGNGDLSRVGEVYRRWAVEGDESWRKIQDMWNGTGMSVLGRLRMQGDAGGGRGFINPSMPGAELKGSAGGASGKGGKSKGSGAADPSQMGYFETALSEQKALLQQHNKLLDDAKAYELAYWQQVLNSARLSENDRLAIKRKTAQLVIELAQQEAKDRQALDRDNIETWKQLELLKIDGQRIAAKALLDDDQITKAQFLQREIEFEERRYQVMLEYYAKRRLLNGNDPVANAKLDGDLQVEGAQHANKVAGLQADKNKAKGIWDIDSDKMFEGLGQSASAGFAQILKGAQTWQQGMQTIFTNIRDSFLKAVVLEPMNAQIAAWGKQLAMKLGFLGKEEAAQGISSAKVAGTKATETTAVASANAIQAGTGAAASQAAIPIVGPALAMASMAAIFAAVMALGGKMKSARNGYDIPAGVNPITQLHEEEMVLPKEQANAVREMAANGGGGAGSTFAPQINIQAMDARSVAQALRRGGALESALRGLHRDFVKV